MIDLATLKIYRASRTPHVSYYGVHQVPAKGALLEARRRADTERRWDRAEDAGLVRMEALPDEHTTYEDLEGDTFTPELHPGHPGKERTILAEQKKQRARIDADGVWFMQAQFRTRPDAEWQDGDSCGGFIGDDFDGSGYDTDLKNETLDALADALRGRCPTCRR